jgi:hypothetical protein
MFEPKQDARPDDVRWPEVVWSPAADVVLAGSWVELRPSVLSDGADLRRSKYRVL